MYTILYVLVVWDKQVFGDLWNVFEVTSSAGRMSFSIEGFKLLVTGARLKHCNYL